MSVATLRQRFSAPEPRPEIRVTPPLLEAVEISKRFGTQPVLDRVNLRLRPGSFHALLGENGAGKSTLVKCIMGYYPADAGGFLVDNREQTMASTRDAHALGIGMVSTFHPGAEHDGARESGARPARFSHGDPLAAGAGAGCRSDGDYALPG